MFHNPMNFLLLFTFILPSLSPAESIQCRDIFLKNEVQSEILLDSGLDFLNSIPQMIGKAKKFTQERKFNTANQTFFREILKLRSSDLEKLHATTLLQIFDLFSKWKLLPPRQFQVEYFTALRKTLPNWTNKDFLNFALARKLTPMRPPHDFMDDYKNSLFQKFDSFDVVTKMEVFGAELFHSTEMGSRQIIFLLNQTASSLQATPHILRLKPLKELFRGLRFLRAHQPTQFFIPMVKLEMLIERQLQQQGLSLNQDGRSGDTRERQSITWERSNFEYSIQLEFPGVEKIDEYSDPSLYGFYDPVDLYYPQLRLIVEWDGPHHYYSNIDLNGNILSGVANLTLRPLDSAKDSVLKTQGYYILRIPRELNGQWNEMSIKEMILLQNPTFEYSDFELQDDTLLVPFYNAPQDTPE